MKMTDFGGLGGENGLSSRIASRFEAFSHSSYMFGSDLFLRNAMIQ